MSGPTLFGKILSRLQSERWFAHKEAVDDLWERNGLGNPTQRTGYKLAETKAVQQDGTEVTYYRLYKLVDSSTVVISTELTTKIEKGISGGEETTNGHN